MNNLGYLHISQQEEYEAWEKEELKWKKKDCATCTKKNILIKPFETSCKECRLHQKLAEGRQLTSSLPDLNLTDMNSYLGLN